MSSSVTEISDPIAQSVVHVANKRANHNAQAHAATLLGPAPADGDLPRGARG